MKQIFSYIWSNKEWIFSGIGVAILTTIFFRVHSKEKYKVIQKQKSGDGSFNIQIGRDLKFNEKNEGQK